MAFYARTYDTIHMVWSHHNTMYICMIIVMFVLMVVRVIWVFSKDEDRNEVDTSTEKNPSPTRPRRDLIEARLEKLMHFLAMVPSFKEVIRTRLGLNTARPSTRPFC